jgi:1-deoxy-D-xylulose-5-phosphate reductoisomerase
VAKALKAKIAVISNPKSYNELKEFLAGSGIEAAAGEDAMCEAAARKVDWTLGRGGMIALANKECLVCAGEAFMRDAREAGAEVLPVDSEHNAIAQALMAGKAHEVSKIILTASGGPFRTWTREQIATAKPENALKHPTWTMGRKVTIDSASLMNKGLELIEAHHLFNVGSDQLDVLVHPQSVVHGLVTFSDGSVVAGLAPADMRVPIAHCLGWPDRIVTNVAPLDLAKVGSLTFEPVDHARFPALKLALAALDEGGGIPTILNAANEIAVAAFLDHKLDFPGIPHLVETVIGKAKGKGLARTPQSVEDALNLDREARRLAVEELPTPPVFAA